MKAWRLHNMKLAAKAKMLERELEFFLDTKHEAKIQAQLKQCSVLKLRNKFERRNQFAAEVATPSPLLYKLFLHVGLPTPPEFANSLS